MRLDRDHPILVDISEARVGSDSRQPFGERIDHTIQWVQVRLNKYGAALVNQNASTIGLHKRDAITLLFSNMASQQPCGAMQMAYAGVWDRFPRLKMYWAETMAG